MPTEYRHDFFAWTREQAALIRAGRVTEIDWAQVAEEVEDLGRSEKRAMESCLEVLLMHLLKWQCQRDRRSKSWQRTIQDQRRRLARLQEENPSLRTLLAESIAAVYPSAVVGAANETGLDEEHFPADCPYDQERLFDPDVLPD